jgi:hypothetical protein
VRWADDLGRPPTAQETGLPGTRVPYRAIQRELGGFNTALKAAGLPRRLPGQRAGNDWRNARGAQQGGHAALRGLFVRRMSEMMPTTMSGPRQMLRGIAKRVRRGHDQG